MKCAKLPVSMKLEERYNMKKKNLYYFGADLDYFI